MGSQCRANNRWKRVYMHPDVRVFWSVYAYTLFEKKCIWKCIPPEFLHFPRESRLQKIFSFGAVICRNCNFLKDLGCFSSYNRKKVYFLTSYKKPSWPNPRYPYGFLPRVFAVGCSKRRNEHSFSKIFRPVPSDHQRMVMFMTIRGELLGVTAGRYV